MDKSTQAKHITKAYFLWGMVECGSDRSFVSRWDLAEVLGFPEKVVLAKARKLIRQDIIDGCGCGCRGDLTIVTDEVRETRETLGIVKFGARVTIREEDLKYNHLDLRSYLGSRLN